MNRQYYELQPSERAIFRAAAEIYAGYVAMGKVEDSNEKLYMEKSISAALTLSRQIENIVQSDGETGHGA